MRVLLFALAVFVTNGVEAAVAGPVAPKTVNSCQGITPYTCACDNRGCNYCDGIKLTNLPWTGCRYDGQGNSPYQCDALPPQPLMRCSGDVSFKSLATKTPAVAAKVVDSTIPSVVPTESTTDGICTPKATGALNAIHAAEAKTAQACTSDIGTWSGAITSDPTAKISGMAASGKDTVAAMNAITPMSLESGESCSGEGDVSCHSYQAYGSNGNPGFRISASCKLKNSSNPSGGYSCQYANQAAAQAVAKNKTTAGDTTSSGPAPLNEKDQTLVDDCSPNNYKERNHGASKNKCTDEDHAKAVSLAQKAVDSGNAPDPAEAARIQKSISDAGKNLDADKKDIATDQKALTNAQADLSTANNKLSADNAKLSSAQATLTTDQQALKDKQAAYDTAQESRTNGSGPEAQSSAGADDITQIQQARDDAQAKVIADQKAVADATTAVTDDKSAVAQDTKNVSDDSKKLDTAKETEKNDAAFAKMSTKNKAKTAANAQAIEMEHKGEYTGDYGGADMGMTKVINTGITQASALVNQMGSTSVNTAGSMATNTLISKGNNATGTDVADAQKAAINAAASAQTHAGMANSAFALLQGFRAFQHLSSESAVKNAANAANADLAKNQTGGDTAHTAAIIAANRDGEIKAQNTMVAGQLMTTATTAMNAAKNFQQANMDRAQSAAVTAGTSAFSFSGATEGGYSGTGSSTDPTSAPGAVLDTAADTSGSLPSANQVNPNGDNGIGNPGDQGKFVASAPTAGGPTGGASGAASTGGTSAAKDDASGKDNSPAAKSAVGSYSAGDTNGGYQRNSGGGGAAVGVDNSFADLLKKFLPGGEEDKKKDDASATFDNRSPASDNAAVIARNKNIFDEIHKRYEKKNSEGAIVF